MTVVAKFSSDPSGRAFTGNWSSTSCPVENGFRRSKSKSLLFGVLKNSASFTLELQTAQSFHKGQKNSLKQCYTQRWTTLHSNKFKTGQVGLYRYNMSTINEWWSYIWIRGNREQCSKRRPRQPINRRLGSRQYPAALPRGLGGDLGPRPVNRPLGWINWRLIG